MNEMDSLIRRLAATGRTGSGRPADTTVTTSGVGITPDQDQGRSGGAALPTTSDMNVRIRAAVGIHTRPGEKRTPEIGDYDFAGYDLRRGFRHTQQ